MHEVVVRVEEEHSASSSSSVSGVFPKLSTCVTNHIFSFLSVQTLYQKQGVSRAFRQQCKVALKLKKQQQQPTGSATSVFTSRQALHSAVDAYCRCKYWRNRDESLAEQVATKYGWFIENWNVSQVTEFVYIFYQKRNFREDLSKWDVSSATSMAQMFRDAKNFTGDLSRWDVSNVTTMKCMFWRATSFDSDLSGWDVSQVVDMCAMFCGASNFSGLGLQHWNVSNVTNMVRMFQNATKFQADLSRWDVSNVQHMEGMFEGTSITPEMVATWDDVWNLTPDNQYRHVFGNTSL